MTDTINRTLAHAMREASGDLALHAQPDQGLDLDDDTPLAPACDLSGDGTCEACQ